VASGRVFIVDDDEAVRDSLRLLLEAYGMAVEDYASTAEFARGYRIGGGDACLILDQHLPGSTGLDFLSSSDGAKLDLPVILLTGRADAAIRARAVQLGVRAFLEKPVSDDGLLAAIRSALNGTGRGC
jgi:two-component system, LuxR family, response regulator FixJ